jgi:hypothetical protein
MKKDAKMKKTEREERRRRWRKDEEEERREEEKWGEVDDAGIQEQYKDIHE